MKPLAIITGTTQGLGKELAVRLARERRVLSLNRRDTGSADNLICDLADAAAVAATVGELMKRCRAEAEVEFYLNAGTYGDDVRFSDARPAAIGQLMYANVFGQLALVEGLLSAGQAVKLVAVSSSMGSVRRAPEAYHFAYGSSKAALNLCIRLLRSRESRLDYLLIDPGWMQTRMGGAGATENPGAVADHILALRNKAANWNRDDGMIEANTGEIIPW